MSKKFIVVWSWFLATLIAIVIVGVWMTVGGSRQLLLVGQTTDAHHQIEVACETCHKAPIFSGPAVAVKAMNKACRTCHEDELAKSDDSHPRKKFRNPRMAQFWDKLDARLCTTCHTEHRPEITRESAVTVATNFCIACHSEGDQDVRMIRTSHADLSFDTCASSGCHNYHDNRVLYSDFLVKHAQTDWLTQKPVHELTRQARLAYNSEEERLMHHDAQAPSAALSNPAILRDWADSAHAINAINCTSCHAPAIANGSDSAGVETVWEDKPNQKICADCHKFEQNTFRKGRHGMRRHPKIANPRDIDSKLNSYGLAHITPSFIKEWISDPAVPLYMTVAEARLPMRSEAADFSVGCGSCHDPHSVNVAYAAVDACLTCHDDTHSKAYRKSPHYTLWLAEVAGEAIPGTGVSCATCHMAKVERRGNFVTDHNQNDILRPNEKMIRPVCLDCHGLKFALDSLADDELIERNFRGKPDIHVESIEWALLREREGQDD